MWFDEKRELLGSELRITFAHTDETIAKELLEKCWQRLEDFQKKYSRFLSDNYLAEINHHLDTWQEIDEETYDLLERVNHFKVTYQLNFDLAVKTNLENLGYDTAYTLTTKSEPQPVQSSLEIKDGHLLNISKPIEFGGFGKGYALDLARSILEDIDDFCLDFGGDLYAQGKNPEGNPWKIILEHPLHSDQAIGEILLDKKFLAASSPSKRSWGKNKKLHHLIDPTTGKPANYWLGTFVLADNGFTADYLATALFCTPENKIQELASNLTELQFLLINTDQQAMNHNFPAQLW